MSTQFEKYHNRKVEDNLHGWKPSVLIHVGEFLEDALDEYNMSQIDLATRTGFVKKNNQRYYSWC